jgi:hypothetical protein
MQYGIILIAIEYIIVACFAIGFMAVLTDLD